MRFLLLVGAAAAAWAVWRRRAVRPRVHVAWLDGAELDLRSGSVEHARLVAHAERVLR
jgi:hypothetical protein